MSARDVMDVATDIACGVGNQFGGHIYEGCDRDTIELGIRRLTAAGYRLIGPGELDRETIDAREHAKRLEQAVAFTAKMAWRTDPPNANSKLTDSERLSAIKHHPTIKRYGEPDRELAAKEAASRPLPLQETEK